MKHYIVRRLLATVVTLVGIIVAAFFILNLAGDPTTGLLGENATPEDIARLRHLMGFDRPLWQQFTSFVWQAVHGDFGKSFYYRLPAMSIVLERVPATFDLMLVALAVTVAIAFPLGMVAAHRRGSFVDSAATAIGAFGQAVPGFFLAILLIYAFSVKLKWLPAFGREDWRSYLMPALVLGVYGAAPLTRLLRSTLQDVLTQDYIRTAQAKGLSPRKVLLRHALRNALIPTVTLLGMQIGVLLGGSVITETVFAWPGMGRLLAQSILQRDYPVVQAAVTLTGLIFLGINLVVDLLYGWIDPRIRY